MELYQPVLEEFRKAGIFFDSLEFIPEKSAPSLRNDVLAKTGKAAALIMICDNAILAPLRTDLFRLFQADPNPTDAPLLLGNTTLFILGTASEGVAMAKQSVIPYIEQQTGNSHGFIAIREMGAPLEELKSALETAKSVANGTAVINVSENYGDIRIEILYDRHTSHMTLNEMQRVIVSRLDPYVYSVDDTPIAQCLVDYLKAQQMRISTGESFTGGGVGKRISEIPGASAVYFEGINSYNELSKQQRLGVNEKTLWEHGAVSGETAYEMAAGLILSGNCQISVSTTGNAGPLSDKPENPVGLCYIAVGFPDQVFVHRHYFVGDRTRITQMGIHYALFHAYQHLRNRY